MRTLRLLSTSSLSLDLKAVKVPPSFSLHFCPSAAEQRGTELRGGGALLLVPPWLSFPTVFLPLRLSLILSPLCQPPLSHLLLPSPLRLPLLPTGPHENTYFTGIHDGRRASVQTCLPSLPQTGRARPLSSRQRLLLASLTFSLLSSLFSSFFCFFFLSFFLFSLSLSLSLEFSFSFYLDHRCTETVSLQRCVLRRIVDVSYRIVWIRIVSRLSE